MPYCSSCGRQGYGTGTKCDHCRHMGETIEAVMKHQIGGGGGPDLDWNCGAMCACMCGILFLAVALASSILYVIGSALLYLITCGKVNGFTALKKKDDKQTKNPATATVDDMERGEPKAAPVVVQIPKKSSTPYLPPPPSKSNNKINTKNSTEGTNVSKETSAPHTPTSTTIDNAKVAANKNSKAAKNSNKNSKAANKDSNAASNNSTNEHSNKNSKTTRKNSNAANNNSKVSQQKDVLEILEIQEMKNSLSQLQQRVNDLEKLEQHSQHQQSTTTGNDNQV